MAHGQGFHSVPSLTQAPDFALCMQTSPGPPRLRYAMYSASTPTPAAHLQLCRR
jgi:hypothetical protein